MMNFPAKNRAKRRLEERLLCVTVVFALSMMLPAMAVSAATEEGGVLEREINGRQDVISVRLSGVTEYELTEMFNDLLMDAPGVVEAKRYRFRLDPRRPAGCVVEWQVRIKDTDAFQLESHLYRVLRQALPLGSENETPFFTFQPTQEDLRRFRNIRPWMASSREIEFVMAHPWHSKSRGTGQPFKADRNWQCWPDAGFE